MDSLRDFLSNRLDLDDGFVQDIGNVSMRRVHERKPKYEDEIIVTFEDKSVRDTVKPQEHCLAKHRNEAGMRLHIPDHLQKSFRALMNLSYDIKRKRPSLKRSIKFDEDALDLYMDIQVKGGDDWKRIEPEQALQADQ